MIKFNQSFEWIKMDSTDPSTWPDPTNRVLIVTSITNWRDKLRPSKVIRAGWISTYKTIKPRFRADFSIKSEEIDYKDIIYWSYENTNF